MTGIFHSLFAGSQKLIFYYYFDKCFDVSDISFHTIDFDWLTHLHSIKLALGFSCRFNKKKLRAKILIDRVHENSKTEWKFSFFSSRKVLFSSLVAFSGVREGHAQMDVNNRKNVFTVLLNLKAHIKAQFLVKTLKKS